MKTKQLMLYRVRIAVCCETAQKNINAPCVFLCYVVIGLRRLSVVEMEFLAFK
jgi:hypothetical protein